ncbi:MAG: hypothetical protein IT519_16715 [Burkholderiales bacterium]|nr:hypothetical protein [Burkholderiales bacterium]
MPCSPQRYLANNRNLINPAASVVLTPSSVEPVEDLVIETPVARDGSAAVELSGAYTGSEEATYEVEVVDTAADSPTISAPIYAGAGSSRLVGITSTGLDAQEIAVELVDAGRPAVYAAVSFEGVLLKARAAGTAGNSISVSIDQSGLTFDATDYALLVDLAKGQGGPTSGLEGAGFDWETAILGADDVIPASAKRVAFGDDRSTVYLAYKAYENNRWRYHFVPEIQRDIPKGTPVKFVTGGRVVTITDGVTPEVYSSIATVYDLLSQVRATSLLCTVDGVVANDRSPEGQAARDLLVRTDAHVEPSTGTGSEYARAGLASAFANANAGTELVVIRCYATSAKEHSLARLGAERWTVTSSLGGSLGDAVSGLPFVDPVAVKFGFTIPVRLPANFGTLQGKFSHVATQYQPREAGVENPPLCPVALTAGIAATDQAITLRWTKRPSGECNCTSLPVPRLSARCLGLDSTEGGEEDMSYSTEAVSRLKDLYDWGALLAAAVTRYVTGYARDGITEAQVAVASLASLDPDSTTGAYLTKSVAAFPIGEGVTVTENFANQPGVMAPVDLAAVQTQFADDVTAQLRDVLDMYETGIATIDLVEDSSLKTDGFAQWDAALATWRADFVDSVDEIIVSRLKNLTIEKYRVLVRQAIAYAGVSPMGKSDASALTSGDGCWQDYPEDQYYWSVEGSVGGGYAPAFVNRPYYSSRKLGDDDSYNATQEFGFQVNCACPTRLIEGDTIILSLGDAGYPPTYQVGDEIILPVIAAAPLALAGGRDDDSTQTWSVTGSVDGPFAPWVFTPGDSDMAYTAGGLAWDREERGIPSQKGDRVSFTIEGGHYRWRKNAGAWSSSLPIPTTATALDSGLFIRFVAGVAPSFATGDLYEFAALQPWAVSNLRSAPAGKRWRWAEDSTGPTLDIDLGSAQDLDTLAIADHAIPAGATITLEGGLIAAGEWAEPVTWRDGVIVQTLSTPRSARYLRLTLASAGAGYIGWLWLGEALATALAAEVQIRSAYKMARASGPLYEGAATLGKTRSASVTWTTAALVEDDGQALIAMFDHLKANNDEPLILVAHVNRPEDAIYGKVVADETDFVELSDQQRNDTTKRRYGGSMSVQGVWRR